MYRSSNEHAYLLFFLNWELGTWKNVVERFIGGNTLSKMALSKIKRHIRRRYTQHNDTLHKGIICDIKYNDIHCNDTLLLCWMVFYLLLCWMSLCWVSLCWMSWHHTYFNSRTVHKPWYFIKVCASLLNVVAPIGILQWTNIRNNCVGSLK